MEEQPRIEYVEARRVLLDALAALREQIDAVALVGAQAVYLRTAGRLPTYQPFTTDADLVLDPARLGDRPPLGDVMRRAGFVLRDEPGIWEARFARPGVEEEIVVPVDLIVPMQVAAGAGRRGARLGGDHGKHTARKSDGLEGALVDNSIIEITALDPADDRRTAVGVAGEAALLVAKLFKLGERLAQPDRLEAKDAGDVYRLFDVASPDEMAARLGVLLEDDRSSATTSRALDFGDRLFGSPQARGEGCVLPSRLLYRGSEAHRSFLRRSIQLRPTCHRRNETNYSSYWRDSPLERESVTPGRDGAAIRDRPLTLHHSRSEAEGRADRIGLGISRIAGCLTVHRRTAFLVRGRTRGPGGKHLPCGGGWRPTPPTSQG